MQDSATKCEPTTVRRLRSFWLGETDLAPVAVFRILYGLQLFNWSWQLYPNLNAFFTDEGILPRREVIVTYSDRFSVLNLVGEWWQVALIWALTCAVGLLLAIGWRTRLMCVMAFVLVTGWSWRDPLVLDGSDFVFRLVPLWLAFTAAGELYSIDAFLRGTPHSGRGQALQVRVLELQIAWIYLATGIEKVGGLTWIDGTATYYALQLEHTFGRSWAHGIATQPIFYRPFSWGTLVTELGFLPLAMIPSHVTRLIAVIAAGGLQLGILFLMNVGNFPVIMLSALVLFLPPQWVRRFMRDTSSTLASAWTAREWGARSAIGATALIALAGASFATAMPEQLDVLRPRGDVASFLRFLSVDQRWQLFAPNPSNVDGWMRGPARLTDGTTYDLYTGGAAADHAERFSDALYTRWVKVHDRIANAAYGDYRLEYARYFCRQRNWHLRPGQAPLDTFELYYVERTIQPPENGAPVFREVKLWEHKC